MEWPFFISNAHQKKSVQVRTKREKITSHQHLLRTLTPITPALLYTRNLPDNRNTCLYSRKSLTQLQLPAPMTLPCTSFIQKHSTSSSSWTPVGWLNLLHRGSPLYKVDTHTLWNLSQPRIGVKTKSDTHDAAF